MTMWPAGSSLTCSTRIYGGSFGSVDTFRVQAPQFLRCIYTQWPKQFGILEYYAPYGTYLMPYVAGAISGCTCDPMASFTGSTGVVAAKTMEGAGTVTLTGTMNAGLYVTMSGTDTVTSVTGSVALGLALQMQCTYSGSFTGSTLLSVTVPVAGAATFSLTGALNLQGLSSMQCTWSPFTELSPENLAAAVMSAARDTPIHANIQYVNDIEVQGVGTDENPWNPV